MTDVVTLTVPVGRRWGGVVELVLAGLGARLDLTYEKIDELQLAVGTVLDDAVSPDVHVEATAAGGRVDVRVGPLAASAVDDAARRRVLGTLADGLELVSADDAAWAVLTFARGGAR